MLCHRKYPHQMVLHKFNNNIGHLAFPECSGTQTMQLKPSKYSNKTSWTVVKMRKFEKQGK